MTQLILIAHGRASRRREIADAFGASDADVESVADGASALELRPAGEWVQHLEIPMTLYDGGIKSTDAFIFDPDGPDSPPGTAIQLLSNAPRFRCTR